MDHFKYKNGTYFCEDISIEDIVSRFHTPCYIYSESTLEAHCKRFLTAFSKYPSTLCSFAVKANNNLSILKKIFSLGFGADVVSIGEIKKAILAGVDAEKIVFSGASKTKQEIDEAIQLGIRQFNVESDFELAYIAGVASMHKKDVAVSFRVNPNIDAHTHPKITTGLAGSKFGIDEPDVYKLASEYKDHPYLKIQGISCHIGSQMKDLSPIRDTAKRMVGLYQDLKSQGVPLSSIDLGGGVGILYKDEKVFSLEEYADCIIEELKDSGATLILEPGRVIVGNSGILVAQVVGIKQKRDRSFVMLDAGMNDLVRPAMYGSYHKIVPVAEPICSCGHTGDCNCDPGCKCGCNKNTYSFAGPICESSDIFASDIPFSDLKAEDLVAIRGAGAYGMSMASNYNSRPLVAEIMVYKDQIKLIRKRQSLEEMIKDEKECL